MPVVHNLHNVVTIRLMTHDNVLMNPNCPLPGLRHVVKCCSGTDFETETCKNSPHSSGMLKAIT